jgi:hypothetical protein
MATVTANLGLTQPAFGDTGWNTVLNTNASILDAAINPWFYGLGAPGTVAGQTNGSFYLDTAALNLYKRIAGLWVLVCGFGGAGASSDGYGGQGGYGDEGYGGVTGGGGGLGGLTTAVMGETPSGSVNGSNAVYTTVGVPSSGTDAAYLQGIRLTRGIDYTLSSSTWTLTVAPSTGDTLRMDYTTGVGSTEVMGETPSGSVNGSNAVFTTVGTPASGTDAAYLQGMRLTRGTDYTVTGSTWTLTVAPATGDTLRMDYST